MERDFERLTPEKVAEYLFDPEGDGILRWKIRMGNRGLVNTIAGTCHVVRCEKRWTIQINGSKFLRSRLVFALWRGRWPHPHLVLDHIDKNTLNDSHTNLREVTAQQNIETREPFRYWKERRKP